MYTYSMLDPRCCLAPLVADFKWLVAAKQFCLWPVLVSLVHGTQSSLESKIIGQLPLERISADYMFCRVGGDFTGPFHIKLGHTCRPTIVKAYTCIFVCLLVKATHIEAVSNLSMEGGLYCLLQTQSDHEWSWIKFYQCLLTDQRAHWLPESAEDPRRYLRILQFSASAVAVHPWKCTPLRWTLWHHCLQHEDSPMPHTLASETELMKNFLLYSLKLKLAWTVGH